MPWNALVLDTVCLKIAARLLCERPRGSRLFLPISYSSLTRPSLRDAYQAMLLELPSERRVELAAAVYDVPRDPAFTALRQMRALVEPHVASIDLRLTGPGFEIEKLPLAAVTSITLMLPEGDAHQRLAALRRFAERLSHCKQRRIWPAAEPGRGPGGGAGQPAFHPARERGSRTGEAEIVGP